MADFGLANDCALKKISRVRNAENTFVVTEQRKFKNVILIDDAVGSGSTLNQIAGKIKNKDVARNVIGLAVVGSSKALMSLPMYKTVPVCHIPRFLKKHSHQILSDVINTYRKALYVLSLLDTTYS